MEASTLCHKVAYEPQTIVGGQEPSPSAYSRELYGLEIPNLTRYKASFEAVPPPSKTSNRGTYCLSSDWSMKNSLLVIKRK